MSVGQQPQQQMVRLSPYQCPLVSASFLSILCLSGGTSGLNLLLAFAAQAVQAVNADAGGAELETAADQAVSGEGTQCTCWWTSFILQTFCCICLVSFADIHSSMLFSHWPLLLCRSAS